MIVCNKKDFLYHLEVDTDIRKKSLNFYKKNWVYCYVEDESFNNFKYNLKFKDVNNVLISLKTKDVTFLLKVKEVLGSRRIRFKRKYKKPLVILKIKSLQKGEFFDNFNNLLKD